MRLSIEYLLISLLFVATAHAQSSPIRNDTPTTLRDLGANLNVGANYAVDQYGQIRIGNITPGTGATSLGKAEDSVHTSTDVGVFSLAVQASAPTVFAGNGDYAPFATSGNTGGLFTELAAGTLATNPVQAEDEAFAASDAVMVTGGQREDALTTNTGTTGDITPFKTDGNGRQIVTNAPPGESWQSCSASNTGTSDVAIKAAVASNRIYVTSISCFNTAAVASSFQIRDGTTAIYVGAVSNSTLAGVGSWTATFPTPLRGTVNTALNFLMGTTATATTCCAAGYISVL